MSLRIAGRRAMLNLPPVPSLNTYEGLISTRCRPLSTRTAGNTNIMSRSAHVAADDIHSLKIAFANMRLTDSNSTEQGSGDVMTLTASAEYPAGTFTQITWGGSASTTIANGALSISDYTAGDLAIPSGATFWIRMFNTNPTAIMYNGWRNSALGDVTRVGTGAVTDQTMGGTITSSGNYSCPPLMIIGQTKKMAVVGIGDSKLYGYADTAESATAAGPGLRGEVFKGFDAAVPFLNLATGGLQAKQWPTQSAVRGQLLPYFSHFVVELAHNDFYVAVDSVAQVQASVEAIIAAIKAANAAAKVTVTTPGHKANSTNGWIDLAGQTALSGNREAYANIVRAGGLAGQNNGYIEIAHQLESSPGSGKWKFDGTVNKYTADGIHESPAGYDLIVAAGVVQAWLAAQSYP